MIGISEKQRHIEPIQLINVTSIDRQVLKYQTLVTIRVIFHQLISLDTKTQCSGRELLYLVREIDMVMISISTISLYILVPWQSNSD